MTEWDAIYNKAVNGEFKLTRQNNATEHTLQERVVEVLRRHWCIAIDTDVMDALKWSPSDLARIKYIKHHKARGYTNGQPDLVVLMPRGRCVLVELKEQKYGRQSDEQKAYQTAAENLGYEYYIWRSVADAEKFFKGDNVQTNGSGGGSPLTPKLPPLKAE
jgi:hypothetical protein